MAQPLVRRQTLVVGAPAAAPLEFPRLAVSSFRAIKRTLDLAAALFIAIAALPAAFLIALAIKLESGGPILFSHERIGKGGRRFRLWKFRTMVVNGEEVLEQYLSENPAQFLEWQHNRKLKFDPRVTKVGRLLRRTSLDELPQLWNIFRGDMSMVGPRPIVDEEVSKYGSAFHLYTLAMPGLTGLWQVSGRNDTTYRQRVALDSHYVRYWSPILDIMVLLKTVRVVLRGKGAY